MIWAFELNSDRPALARWCFSEGLTEGVILRPIGNTLYLMPPYVLSEAELDHLAQAAIAIVGRA